MNRWFLRILVITVLLQTAVYAMRPMVSYKALSLGSGAFELGAITASFAVLSLLVAVPIGGWVDRWGEPRFIVLGAVLIAGTAAWVLAIDSLWALALNQALLGLGHVLVVVGSQTLVANRGEPAKRDGRFGAFTVVVSVGQLVGPAAAGLLAGAAGTVGAIDAPPGTDSVFVGATAICILAAAVAVSLCPRGGAGPAVAEAPGDSTGGSVPGRGSFSAVLRIQGMRQAMLASLTVLTSIDLLVAYLPAYGESTGLSVETVGLLLAARAAASMASRLLMLPLISLLGRRRLLALSMVLPALGLLSLLIVDGVWPLSVAMCVIGFGLGIGQPITLAWVADRAPATIRGTALGVRLSGNRLGQTVLPVLIGLIAGGTGLAAVFVSLAALLAMSTAAVVTAPLDPEPPVS